MNIIIFNITLNWVYRLYNDYLSNIVNFIKNDNKNIKIINEFYDKTTYSKEDIKENKIKYLLYFDKIILSGDVSLINEIIEKNGKCKNLYVKFTNTNICFFIKGLFQMLLQKKKLYYF